MILILFGVIAAVGVAAAVSAIHLSAERRKNVKRANKEEQERLDAGMSIDDWWGNK